jgi:hypothetical protein
LARRPLGARRDYDGKSRLGGGPQRLTFALAWRLGGGEIVKQCHHNCDSFAQ